MAAAEGNPKAMRKLSEMYPSGDMVEKDQVKAKEWLKKAEEIEIMLKARGWACNVSE